MADGKKFTFSISQRALIAGGVVIVLVAAAFFIGRSTSQSAHVASAASSTSTTAHPPTSTGSIDSPATTASPTTTTLPIPYRAYVPTQFSPPNNEAIAESWANGCAAVSTCSLSISFKVQSETETLATEIASWQAHLEALGWQVWTEQPVTPENASGFMRYGWEGNLVPTFSPDAMTVQMRACGDQCSMPDAENVSVSPS